MASRDIGIRAVVEEQGDKAVFVAFDNELDEGAIHPFGVREVLGQKPASDECEAVPGQKDDFVVGKFFSEDPLLGTEIDDPLVEDEDVRIKPGKRFGCLRNGGEFVVVGRPEDKSDSVGITEALRIAEIAVRAVQPMTEREKKTEAGCNGTTAMATGELQQELGESEDAEDRKGCQIEKNRSGMRKRIPEEEPDTQADEKNDKQAVAEETPGEDKATGAVNVSRSFRATAGRGVRTLLRAGVCLCATVNSFAGTTVSGVTHA